MEQILHILQGDFLNHFHPLLLISQLLVLSFAAALAFWLQGYINDYADVAADRFTKLQHLLLPTLQRVVLPISMVFFILPGLMVIERFYSDPLLLDAALPLLLSLALVRMLVYLIIKAFRPGPLLEAWEQPLSTLLWLITAMYMLGCLPNILLAMDLVGVTVGEARISLHMVVKLFIFILILTSMASWLSRIIDTSVRKVKHFTPATKVGISKSSKFTLYILAIMVSLNSVGIDLTALAVFGGALGVGLGFGLQRISSNFISGFILIFDRSIRPGDVISINERFGWVQELRARYVVVRDRNGVETLIPNENLITSEVINWSYSDHKVRIKLPVTISYNDDLDKAMAILIKAAQGCQRVLNDPPPIVNLMAFGNNGLELELRVWIIDPAKGVGFIRSEVNQAIWKEFQRVGITIPYPQRDVRMKDG